MRISEISKKAEPSVQKVFNRNKLPREAGRHHIYSVIGQIGDGKAANQPGVHNTYTQEHLYLRHVL
jgi:hypothetical protein